MKCPHCHSPKIIENGKHHHQDAGGNPIAQKLTILQWVEGFYDELVFTGETAIASPLLGELDLTAAKLWQTSK